MKHSVLDPDYIVIKIRRDFFYHLLKAAACLILVLPYPLLLLLRSVTHAVPSFFSAVPFMLGYTLFAPALLIAMTARTITGSPPARPIRGLFLIVHILVVLLAGTGVLMFFSRDSSTNGLIFQDVDMHSTRIILMIAFWACAFLWMTEFFLAGLLGEFFWAGYFINAGVCATIFTVLGLSPVNTDAAQTRPLMLPLVCGAILCIIILIALLLQGSMGQTDHSRYNRRL